MCFIQMTVEYPVEIDNTGMDCLGEGKGNLGAGGEVSGVGVGDREPEGNWCDSSEWGHKDMLR